MYILMYMELPPSRNRWATVCLKSFPSSPHILSSIWPKPLAIVVLNLALVGLVAHLFRLGGNSMYMRMYIIVP